MDSTTTSSSGAFCSRGMYSSELYHLFWLRLLLKVENVLLLWASSRLRVGMDHEDQVVVILESWSKTWRKATIPFLGLANSLDEGEMRRACDWAKSKSMVNYDSNV